MSEVVKGLNALRSVLRRYPKQAREATARGQYMAGQIIMLDAKKRAPREDKYLEDSGYCTKPDDSGKSTSIEMGFGGPSEAYVVRQHEDLTLNHPGKNAIAKGVTKVGQAKFFSNAIAAQSRVARDIIADFVRRFFESGRVPAPPQKMVPETPTEIRAVKS